MSRSQQLVTIAVILCADWRTGKGWASYRSLRREFGLSNDAVSGALRAEGDGQRSGSAIGRYLEVSGRGSRGSVQYQILSVASDSERSGTRSADERSGERSALRSESSSAPVLGGQRSERRSHSYPSNLTPDSKEYSSQRRHWSAEDAERVYQAYPRKIGKQKALKAITKALSAIAARNGSVDAVAWMVERVQRFARSAKGQAGEFCPHPATWFNEGRYDDDPAEWQRHSSTGRREPQQRSLGSNDKFLRDRQAR